MRAKLCLALLVTVVSGCRELNPDFISGAPASTGTNGTGSPSTGSSSGTTGSDSSSSATGSGTSSGVTGSGTTGSGTSSGVTGSGTTGTTTGGCTAGSTGLLSPTQELPDAGGDGDGFEGSPFEAFVDDGTAAANINGAGDQHQFFGFGAVVPPGCSVRGISVRLDWWLDSLQNTNALEVELSPDDGSTWTVAKRDNVETTTEHTTVLGMSADRWGRDWQPSEVEDGQLRVRVTSISNTTSRDFFLDWIAVEVHYGDSIQPTGLVGPNAEAPGPGGDGDGFEVSPTGAFSPGGSAAVDVASGTLGGNQCNSVDRDRHDFFDYGLSVPGGAEVHGIELHVDAWSSGVGAIMCVELSWDGGGSWTPAQQTAGLGVTVATFMLGGNSDDWGHSWLPGELDDANFRVRVSNIDNSAMTDFSLDWIPVRVHYTP